MRTPGDWLGVPYGELRQVERLLPLIQVSYIASKQDSRTILGLENVNVLWIAQDDVAVHRQRRMGPLLPGCMASALRTTSEEHMDPIMAYSLGLPPLL